MIFFRRLMRTGERVARPLPLSFTPSTSCALPLTAVGTDVRAELVEKATKELEAKEEPESGVLLSRVVA